MTSLKNLLLIVMMSLPVLDVSAQQHGSNHTIYFRSIDNIGSLKGQAGASLQLETVNGIEMRSWFAGVGAGLDYYRFRSVPLFIQLRKEIGKKESKFFLYGDGGINFAWAFPRQKMRYANNDVVRNGVFAETGLGYKFCINAHNALLITAAYSYKKIVETNQVFLGYAPGRISDQSRYDYNLNRMAIKAGWEF